MMCPESLVGQPFAPKVVEKCLKKHSPGTECAGKERRVCRVTKETRKGSRKGVVIAHGCSGTTVQLCRYSCNARAETFVRLLGTAGITYIVLSMSRAWCIVLEYITAIAVIPTAFVTSIRYAALATSPMVRQSACFLLRYNLYLLRSERVRVLVFELSIS